VCIDAGGFDESLAFTLDWEMWARLSRNSTLHDMDSIWLEGLSTIVLSSQAYAADLNVSYYL